MFVRVYYHTKQTVAVFTLARMIIERTTNIKKKEKKRKGN